MARILALSDVHADWERFYPSHLPESDALLIGGDLTECGTQSPQEIKDARAWFACVAKRFPFVGWIPGNHDLEVSADTFGDLPENVHMLLDRTVKVELPGTDAFTVHGVSCSPAYLSPPLVNRFSYMTADQCQEDAAYDFEGVDCVLSHSPPFGHLDRWTDPHDQAHHIGSNALLSYINRHQPHLVICGHVHEDCGVAVIGNTHVYNVARSMRVIDWNTIVGRVGYYM